MLTARGRRVRLVATALVFGTLLTGTFWGEDDHFPFGPFRMYSRTNRSDGRITAARVEATTVDGDLIKLRWSDLNLRRAELEGQFGRLAEDLSDLAEAWQSAPGRPQLAEVRLLKDIRQLRDDRVVNAETKVVAAWQP